MNKKTLGVTLLGHGTVGGGVAKILTEERHLIEHRTGVSFELRHVVTLDADERRADFHHLPLTKDAKGAIADPATDVVIELMGGIGFANEAMRDALSRGKSVVTANKSLLATHGRELFALARQNNAAIAFEASCGGGIPIIGSLLNGLVANRVHHLVGIVNGTCNFILTQMTRNGASYADALKEAQKAGFAEADPTMDVTGRDAAQKLAILSGLAFDVVVAEGDVHVEGIDQLDAADIRFANELGYIIKLLAIASRPGASSLTPEQMRAQPLSLRVHPTLVHKSDMLAEVSGSFNAISVYGHALGHALFYGRGAGRMPTASAVVADLVSIGLGTAGLAFKQLTTFSDSVPKATVQPFDDLQSRYYLRLSARDEPGAMARVTRILGDHGISLSAILQHEMDDTHFVPVVITTHLAREGAVRAAIAEIDTLSIIAPPTVCLRIIDAPEEFAAGRS